jgi:hypothetical protein
MFGNLLKLASSVIPQQSVEWVRFKERTLNDQGKYVIIYHPAVTVKGSWQAVDTKDVKELGFDTAKRYRMLYTSHNIKDVNRGAAPDYVVFAGTRHDVVGDADWYAQDGWKSLLCVEVTP